MISGAIVGQNFVFEMFKELGVRSVQEEEDLSEEDPDCPAPHNEDWSGQLHQLLALVTTPTTLQDEEDGTIYI